MPVRVTFQDMEMGARLPAVDRGDGHLLTMARVASDGSIDVALVERHTTLYKGQITLDYFVSLHLPGERHQRTCVLCHDNEARCVLVQAMDDAWSLLASIAANPLQFRTIGQECID